MAVCMLYHVDGHKTTEELVWKLGRGLTGSWRVGSGIHCPTPSVEAKRWVWGTVNFGAPSRLFVEHVPLHEIKLALDVLSNDHEGEFCNSICRATP
jgi:hypothetical protein